MKVSPGTYACHTTSARYTVASYLGLLFSMRKSLGTEVWVRSVNRAVLSNLVFPWLAVCAVVYCLAVCAVVYWLAVCAVVYWLAVCAVVYMYH